MLFFSCFVGVEPTKSPSGGQEFTVKTRLGKRAMPNLLTFYFSWRNINLWVILWTLATLNFKQFPLCLIVLITIVLTWYVTMYILVPKIECGEHLLNNYPACGTLPKFWGKSPNSSTLSGKYQMIFHAISQYNCYLLAHLRCVLYSSRKYDENTSVDILKIPMTTSGFCKRYLLPLDTPLENERTKVLKLSAKSTPFCFL